MLKKTLTELYVHCQKQRNDQVELRKEEDIKKVRKLFAEGFYTNRLAAQVRAGHPSVTIFVESEAALHELVKILTEQGLRCTECDPIRCSIEVSGWTT